jgi:predicted Zn-dependent protease
MQKIFLQFAVTLLVFFSLWISLSKVPFVDGEKMKKIDSATEKKLGELVLKTIVVSNNEIKSKKLSGVIDTIKNAVCKAQGIDPTTIRTHIIQKGDINAFALPDRQIVIYSGLITYSNNPEEVAGVIAHELGHIEKNHVMKKLAKEMGLSMLVTLAGSNSGFEILKEVTRMLSSSAFDRKQEQEADDYAFDALVNANIDPENLANFLFRLSKESGDVPEELVWISTHPDSKERAAQILKKREGLKINPGKLLKSSWPAIQASIKQE